jgi:hypothetical protein
MPVGNPRRYSRSRRRKNTIKPQSRRVKNRSRNAHQRHSPLKAGGWAKNVATSALLSSAGSFVSAPMDHDSKGYLTNSAERLQHGNSKQLKSDYLRSYTSVLDSAPYKDPDLYSHEARVKLRERNEKAPQIIDPQAPIVNYLDMVDENYFYDEIEEDEIETWIYLRNRFNKYPGKSLKQAVKAYEKEKYERKKSLEKNWKNVEENTKRIFDPYMSWTGFQAPNAYMMGKNASEVQKSYYQPYRSLKERDISITDGTYDAAPWSMQHGNTEYFTRQESPQLWSTRKGKLEDFMIDEVMEFQPLKSDIVTWRGVSVPKGQTLKGATQDTFINPSFLSTSMSFFTAERFAHSLGKDPFMMEIHAARGVDYKTGDSGEREIIFPPNVVLKRAPQYDKVIDGHERSEKINVLGYTLDHN